MARALFVRVILSPGALILSPGFIRHCVAKSMFAESCVIETGDVFLLNLLRLTRLNLLEENDLAYDNFKLNEKFLVF